LANLKMDSIRNVVMMGHGKCGKTTLAEAMLLNSGAIDRMGKIQEGNTVSDFDQEEIKRQVSIQASMIPIDWKGMKYNIIDTPGYFDFWLPVTELLSGTVTFLNADPYITLTAPSMASNCICVSAASGTEGIPLPYSGRGYLKNGSVKPDISAPGLEIETPFGTVGGTAPAAALTCGAASLFLEWATLRERLTLVNGAEVKALFIRGAKREKSLAYPNPESGFGELDLENVFRVVR